MRNFLVLGSVLFAIMFVSCVNPVIDSPTPTTPITKVNLSLGNASAGSRSLADGAGVVASFRSSAIEFFAVTGDWVLGTPVIYKLSNTDDNSVFAPGSTSLVQAGDNNGFALNGKYYVVRLDVGNGAFTYAVDGVTITEGNVFKNSLEQNRSGIDGNSIFMVKGLTERVYVPRTEFANYTGNAIVQKILSNTGIDMDGALFLPFDGIDTSSLTGEATINIAWNVAGAVRASTVFIGDPAANVTQPSWEQVGRDGMTVPYDFSVTVR